MNPPIHLKLIFQNCSLSAALRISFVENYPYPSLGGLCVEPERWRAIPNTHSNYYASTYGRIKSLISGKILKPADNGLGYMKLVILGKHKYVHVAVCEAFHGFKPGEEYEVNHGTGNKRNNYYLNVGWVTKSQNQKHAFATGLNFTPPERIKKMVESRRAA